MGLLLTSDIWKGLLERYVRIAASIVQYTTAYQHRAVLGWYCMNVAQAVAVQTVA